MESCRRQRYVVCVFNSCLGARGPRVLLSRWCFSRCSQADNFRNSALALGLRVAVCFWQNIFIWKSFVSNVAPPLYGPLVACIKAVMLADSVSEQDRRYHATLRFIDLLPSA